MTGWLLVGYGGQRPQQRPLDRWELPRRSAPVADPPGLTSPDPWPPTFRGVQGETTFRSLRNLTHIRWLQLIVQ
jgi:hypothetical protein